MEKEINNLQDYDYEEKIKIIADLGIYELRAFARGVGVQSPTTKKRDELIVLIKEILKNNTIEIPQKIGRGRPFKKLENMDNILNVIGESTIKNIEMPKTYNYEDLICFAQEIPVFEYQSTEAVKLQGILRIVKRSAYFIDSESELVAFVSCEMVDKSNLKNGDFLQVLAYKINNLNQYTTKQILSINGSNIKDYRILEVEKSRVMPTEIKKICDLKLIQGGKNLLVIDNPLYLEKNAKDIFEHFENHAEHVVFLGVNISFEDNLFLKQFNNINIFATEYGQNNLTKDFNKIVDAISYCERMVELNKSFVICIFDVVNILNSLDLYFSVGESVKVLNHYQQSGVVMKKLIALSQSFSNYQNITQVVFCNEIDVNDEFIKNEIIKVCKRV